MVFSVRGIMTCSLLAVSADRDLNSAGYPHGVYTAVDHFDNLIQYDKGGLQTGQFYQCLDCSCVCLSTPLHLLTTLAQTRQCEVVVAVLGVALELREEDPGDVFLLCPYAEASLLCRLLDLVANVAADGVGDFCEGKCSNLHDPAHLALGLIDAAGDFSKTPGRSYVSRASDIWQHRRCVLGQGLALSLEQIVASLGALELALHQTQRLARGEDGFACLAVVSVVLRHNMEL